jgi:hypothetical protein
MQHFQLRFLDGYSGEVVHAETLKAIDDDQAVSLAEGRRGLARMELVSGDRLIQMWPAFPPIE